jgi:hypothetical protein
MYFQYPRNSVLFEISEASLRLLLKETLKFAHRMKLFVRLHVTVEFILARKFLSSFLKSCKSFTTKNAEMRCLFGIEVLVNVR